MSYAARNRAHDVLDHLPVGDVQGAEIGVLRGEMSAELLKRPDLRLIMVDNWRGNEAWPKGYRPQDMPANRELAVSNTEFAQDRRTILEMDSVEAAKMVKDYSLDFVFIDADHSYQAVKADIGAWASKVKRGGILGGHDYANPRGTFGEEVRRAVDEEVARRGWYMGRGVQTCWYVRL